MDDVSRTANVITQFLEFIGGENIEEDQLVNGFSCRPTRKSKVGRSRTLISRRRRSHTTKNKLNSLRSLVPDVAKVLASLLLLCSEFLSPKNVISLKLGRENLADLVFRIGITEDEVIFLQELHMQAQKLKGEINALESSLAGPDSPDSRGGHEPNISNRETPQESYNLDDVTCRQKIIMQLEIFQVEDKEFNIRLVCVKAARIAATLYEALESLTGFTVQSSNLSSTTSGDRYVFTFTIKVDETDPEMNLASLELCVTRAFLSQGFELLPTHK